MEIQAVIQYYSNASKRTQDSWIFQALVYLMFVADTVCTISMYICVYLYSITHWGDPTYLAKQNWCGTALLVTTEITAVTVQGFLIARYWKMSKNIYVTPVLVIAMLTAAGGWAGTLDKLVTFTEYSQRDQLTSFVTILWSTSAATDIAIALALLWQFSQIRTTFKTTQSLIYKLMVATIQTGTITSIIQVATVATFVTNNKTNIATSFVICLGRFYALSMLHNLNSRAELKRGAAVASDAFSGSIGNATSISAVNAIGVAVSPCYELSVATMGMNDKGTLDLSDHGHNDLNSPFGQKKVSIVPLEP